MHDRAAFLRKSRGLAGRLTVTTRLSSFWRNAAITTLTLLALRGAGVAINAIPRGQFASAPFFRIDTMRERTLGRNLDADPANYYQALLQESDDAPGVALLPPWLLGDPKWLVRAKPLLYHQRDFLYNQYRPNVRVDTPLGPMFTNRFGMVDLEYSVVKPPRTRRLAVLGDSIMRGFGVPYNSRFETLLEEHLNHPPPPGLDRVELLNFAVDGYPITKLLYVSSEKAQQFSPDMYIISLTRNQLGYAWADHVRYVVTNGLDPHYDYLRKLIRETGVTSGLTEDAFREKLNPHYRATMRWALLELKMNAQQHGAQVLVLLTPHVEHPDVLREQFAKTRGLLVELQIPFVDLLDTFDRIDDLDTYRIASIDIHPNVLGHRMVLANFLQKLDADPVLKSVLIGPSAGPQGQSSPTTR